MRRALRHIRVISGGTRMGVTCAVLLVVVTVLRIAVDNPIESVGFLYVVPISLAAIEFGRRGGLIAAAAAMALTGLWAVLQDVPVGAIGFAVRAAMFAGLGALVGSQADQRRTLLEERDELIRELSASAMRDQLTGLANRRSWDERFVRELRGALRSGTPLSLAVVDLDRFKHVNDTHGHAYGDAVIRRCAQALAGAVRDTDFIARVGGDEFFVLLPDCPAEDTADVAQRLLEDGGGELSYSIGIATWDGGERGDALLARADGAMYLAKRAGGRRAAFAPVADPQG